MSAKEDGYKRWKCLSVLLCGIMHYFTSLHILRCPNFPATILPLPVGWCMMQQAKSHIKISHIYMGPQASPLIVNIVGRYFETGYIW